MNAIADIDRARRALGAISPDVPHDDWVRVGLAAHAAGLDLDDFDGWSAAGSAYNAAAVRAAWKSFKPGAIGAGTLFYLAGQNGWQDDAPSKKTSPAELAARRAEQARCAERAAAEVSARHAAAAGRAEALWAAAVPAVEHPYLTRKSVASYGLRVGVWEYTDGETGEVFSKPNCLLIPILDRQKKLHSLQCIDAAGGKWHLSGGAKSGHFYPIGKPLQHAGKPVFVLAEGYATAASVHAATGHLVLVCFDTGNLLHVAQAIRERQPSALIVLAADNDLETPGNPGVSAARRAAEAVLGLVAVPPVAGDFNDLAIAQGAGAVSDVIQTALDATLGAEPLPEPLLVAAAMPDASQALDGTELVEMLPFTDVRDGTADTRPLTEHGNALRLRDTFGDRLRHVPEKKSWPVWDDGRWRMADPGVVRALAGGLAPGIYAEGARHLLDSEHFAKWARKSQERRTIDSAVALLGDMPSVRLPAAALDADPWLCGLNGGRLALDLKTGTCRAATPDDYITKSLAVSQLGDSRKAVRWRQFVGEVFLDDAELIDWFHRFLGYSLTGNVTEQIFVFLFGSGANGKSVLTEAIGQIMGSYSSAIQPATLCDDRRSAAGPSPDLARLDGVRFAVAPEAEEGSRFNESLLKGLVSGDTLQVRELHAAPRDMRPALKLVMTGNHKPHISGTDRGIWRRVRLVPFLASFEGKADPQLLEKLRGESQHILAWLVDGCLEWQRRGLQDTPQAIALATEDYRAESDTLGLWLQERCDQDAGGREQFADLYADFRWWSLQNGFAKVPTSLSFGKRLAEYKINGWSVGAVKHAGKRCRTGIFLRESTPI